MYERPIYVTLSCNGDRVDEKNVEFVNIESDFEGRDKLTFVCPDCGEQHTSFRIG